MLPVPTLQISHIGEEEEVYKAEIVIHVLGSIRGGKTPSEPQSEAMSPTASCFGDDSVDTLESATCSLIGSPLELSPRSPLPSSSKRLSPRPHPYAISPRLPASTSASFLLPTPSSSSASLSGSRSGQLSPPSMDSEEARLAEEEKREKRREKDRIRKRIQREKQRREKQTTAPQQQSQQPSSSGPQNAHSMHMMHQMQMQMQMHMHIAPPPHQQTGMLAPSSEGVSSIPSLSSFLASAQQQQQHQQQQPNQLHSMNGTLPPFSISFCN